MDLVGVAPDLRVHVSRRILDDEDGPMLDVLTGFHGTTIDAPSRRFWRRIPSASPAVRALRERRDAARTARKAVNVAA